MPCSTANQHDGSRPPLLGCTAFEGMATTASNSMCRRACAHSCSICRTMDRNMHNSTHSRECPSLAAQILSSMDTLSKSTRPTCTVQSSCACSARAQCIYGSYGRLNSKLCERRSSVDLTRKAEMLPDLKRRERPIRAQVGATRIRHRKPCCVTSKRGLPAPGRGAPRSTPTGILSSQCTVALKTARPERKRRAPCRPTRTRRAPCRPSLR